MTPEQPQTCQNERLNTIIAVGLIAVLVVCLVLYGMIYMNKGQPDGQLVQLAGTIAGGLVGFIARTMTQHGTMTGKVENMTVTNEAEAAPAVEAGQDEESKP